MNGKQGWECGTAGKATIGEMTPDELCSPTPKIQCKKCTTTTTKHYGQTKQHPAAVTITRRRMLIVVATCHENTPPQKKALVLWHSSHFTQLPLAFNHHQCHTPQFTLSRTTRHKKIKFSCNFLPTQAEH